MKTNEVPKHFKNRYLDIPPLILARSIERAKTLGELFDILEDMPKEFPLIWSEADRRWKLLSDHWLAKGS